ncbi:hypothetical protein [Streptomyces monomycini]|uniref:hypothetical protein n=1 Tax=Streptomyces monomycini TaxID=371720 RepID=UPI0004AA073C|nr:hypothetical protein [Streptomyces monomycini]
MVGLTGSSDFRHAYRAFRAMPYPDRPKPGKLQDLGSDLLDIDYQIAGYAGQVDSGDLSASDIPDLDEHARAVKNLLSAFASVSTTTDEELQVKQKFHAYVATLDRMMVALQRLAAD